MLTYAGACQDEALLAAAAQQVDEQLLATLPGASGRERERERERGRERQRERARELEREREREREREQEQE